MGNLPGWEPIKDIPVEYRPAACIGCRSCEAVCPQQIAIADTLADYAAKLGADRKASSAQ